MKTKIAVVIVCHDSGAVLPLAMSSLEKQRLQPDLIVLVDNGSSDQRYLEPYRSRQNVTLLFQENTGFAAANNRGVEAVPCDISYLLFLNPDALLHETYLEQAVSAMNRAGMRKAGVLCGLTYWYDLQKNCSSQRIDSTGLFRSWYGRWYDRGHGEMAAGHYNTIEQVPGACGAVMFCRKRALQDVAVDGRIFDERFFLYKEDIELSLRLRKHGWEIWFVPDLVAYHSRGWSPRRRAMARDRRLMSAKNELLLYRLHPSPCIVWAFMKYLLVRYANV